MEVRYTNTLGDLLRFNLYHLPRTGTMQVILAGVILLHIWTYGPVVARMDEPVSMKVSVFVITLVLSIVFLGFLQFLFVLFSYRPSRNKGLLTEHVIRLADHGVVEETAFGSTSATWAGIPKVGQNRRYIFVYVQQHSAHIIPKKAFPSATDASSFVDVVRSRINAASGKR
jgi:hypothetical protein